MTSDTKSRGVVGGVSEATYIYVYDYKEWKIPAFLLLNVRAGESFESPAFNSAGCTWKLMMAFPKGNSAGAEQYVSVSLCRTHVETGVESVKVTYILGIKRVDGTTEEGGNYTHTFKKGESSIGKMKELDILLRFNSVLLPSGTLTLTCRMKDGGSTSPKQASSDPSPKENTKQLVDLEALSSDFNDLLVSQRNCDVTVHVQFREFRAHRSVLMARSPVLRAMYEHDTEEARTRVLKIPDCDPDSFADFLGYLYTGRTGEMSFLTAYHLYATAEKYDVQRLKSFCSDYLKQNLSPENVCDVVLLADLYGDDGLASAAQGFFNENSPRIFLTSKWADMMKKHFRLANELLRKMASATLKSP